LAPDVTIFPGTLLQGATSIGEGVELGPETRLIDCTVGDGAVVERTVGRLADIGAGAIVGPFAVLEPGAHIAPGARTGAFYTATAEDSGT
jgi:bifunctional UDP-N-acetylglucosamine pyrophosphorylase/glucosamine-1-phosphate N-acetyltransferase